MITILHVFSIFVFKIIYCAYYFLTKLTQENYNRKESRKDSNINSMSQANFAVIIPTISKDFTENMKTFTTIILNNKNFVIITKPKSGKEIQTEKPTTRDNSSLRPRKDPIPEKFVNSTTISAIYEKFLSENIGNKREANKKSVNRPQTKSVIGDLNRKLESRLIKNISKYTNELVINDLDFINKGKGKARGHTSGNINIKNNALMARNEFDAQRNAVLSRGSKLYDYN